MEAVNTINMVELRNEYYTIQRNLSQLKKYKKCANCGSVENIEIHHIVPLIVGGTNKRSNLVALCQDCHAKIHGLNRQGDKNGIGTGLINSAKSGRILVPGTGLYGYDYDRAQNKLIPNKEEALIVNKIFDLYLEGFGMRRIINYLNNNNIPNKKGGKWNQESIRGILTQYKYIGISIRNKQCKQGKKIVDKPQEEWIVYKYGDKLPDGSTFTSIPPILDEDIFYKVQTIIKSRVDNDRGVYKGTSILAGKIKCGLCGYNYQINSWSYKGIKHEYYVCSNKHLNKKGVCTNSNVQLDKLKELLNDDWLCDLYFRKTTHNLNENYSFEQICKMINCIIVNNKILDITITVHNIQLNDKLRY